MNEHCPGGINLTSSEETGYNTVPAFLVNSLQLGQYLCHMQTKYASHKQYVPPFLTFNHVLHVNKCQWLIITSYNSSIICLVRVRPFFLCTQLGCAEISGACLKMSFEGNPPLNQFSSRASLCKGQPKTPPATGSVVRTVN